ncbi:MAG: hypothetical protein J5767_11445 [Paludibacteraceae bacterium]|nr:hypothetical protein [Paludibacteraceae bacterium]
MNYKTIGQLLFLSFCSMSLFSCVEIEDDDETNKDDKKATEVISISTADELFRFAERVNSGETKLDAELIADIDISGREWIPIGFKPGNDYLGYFKGNKHTITGVTIVEETIEKAYDFENSILEYAYPVGLFSRVGSEGDIQGVELKDVSIVLPKCSQIGGIAGASSGRILTCTVSGSIIGHGGIGGIVGHDYGTVSGCTNYTSIKGVHDIGGVTGLAVTYAISCKNYGKVEGNEIVGGVVGCSGAKTILFNLENYGDVSATTNVGGIIGMAAGEFYNSVNYGKVTGSDFAIGGVIGIIDRGSLAVLGFSYGTPDKVYVENCINYGVVQGPEEGTHAVIGDIYDEDMLERNKLIVSIRNCFYDFSANPLLSDVNALRMDSDTKDVLNEWVAQKPAKHETVAFKIWDVDETGKLTLKKK